MFCLNVILTLKDASDAKEIEGLLTEACRLSRTEPGCLRFDVYYAEAEPATFVLVEHWESEQAWKAHREEKAYCEIYQPLVMPRVERVAHRVKLLIE
ncbi:MAG: antibiotic biosynthesis monooxygenase [Planctomycetes bacterium]|nr:antibiotic biosynthesis monooxygenase [Planctomycetota bacterium]MCH9723635.1 antibiotic biosynthesis monooxygenase [Planctomycetota bacterium]MCH9778453.1 antibiotic biosynthesis monooxygenase [Planctomycetota bacterium]MCH9792509.1 antibiotic biosynthesis monooxygenase [Planctomycetota bacterium]MDF1742291.1 antibiotic biosynthesis monooxygenase [Gimesia sp.]